LRKRAWFQGRAAVAVLPCLIGAGCTPTGTSPGGGFDGLYAGAAQVTVNGNLACPASLPIDDFRVQDNVVLFAGFSVPVDADGALTDSPPGGTYLNGRFGGPPSTGSADTDFRGTLRWGDECLYSINVHRVRG